MNSRQCLENQVRTLSGVAVSDMFSLTGKTLFALARVGAWIERAGGTTQNVKVKYTAVVIQHFKLFIKNKTAFIL